jgi:hypothetical protein
LGLRGGQVHEYEVWGLNFWGKIHVLAENGKHAPGVKRDRGHRAFQLMPAVLAVQIVGRKHQDHNVVAVLRGVHLAGERLACLKPLAVYDDFRSDRAQARRIPMAPGDGSN